MPHFMCRKTYKIYTFVCLYKVLDLYYYFITIELIEREKKSVK